MLPGLRTLVSEGLGGPESECHERGYGLFDQSLLNLAFHEHGVPVTRRLVPPPTCSSPTRTRS